MPKINFFDLILKNAEKKKPYKCQKATVTIRLWGVYEDYTPHRRTTTTSTGGGEPKPPTVE